MIGRVILLLFFVGLVSCDYLGSIFEASLVDAIRNGGTLNKGHVENCNKTAASVNIDWDPEPAIEGKPVTISGDITFLSEDFVEGTVELNAGFYKKSYKLKCSDLGASSCKKGQKIAAKRTFPVPRSIPLSQISVDATLRSDKTSHILLCAKATIHFKQS